MVTAYRKERREQNATGLRGRQVRGKVQGMGQGVGSTDKAACSPPPPETKRAGTFQQPPLKEDIEIVSLSSQDSQPPSSLSPPRHREMPCDTEKRTRRAKGLR
jgi:hypothetical protein